VPAVGGSTHTDIAIIGSGFGGLGTAVHLKREGIDDFVVLERADDVGGTWRDNSYPGCACDVQSHLYSFSFALNPRWTSYYPRQPEIWEYLRRCARDFGVMSHLRFGHEMRSAAWDETALRWRIETSRGTVTASTLVMATGALSEPSIPTLRGLERFAGRVFHSAQWDHEHELAGRHVAVIGTGASAIQFIPEIQPQVKALYLFQRTAPWVLPRFDPPLSVWQRRLLGIPVVHRLLRGLIYAARELMVFAFRRPSLMRFLQRLALRHMHKAVTDPALRAKLTPNYTMGCKRVLLSNDYYPALTRPNVEVITAGIAEVRERSIVDTQGVERAVDSIIFGTGFRATDPPLARHVRGRGGRTLAEAWVGSPKAYVGTTVAGFPNLFILLGPNTGLGHNSVVYMIEAQIEHFIKVVRYRRRHGIAAMEPRSEAQAAFVADVERRMRGTVWVAGGCKSWYLDATGRNSALWPDFSWRFRRRVARLDPSDYVTVPARERRPAAA
jgi:cation diffusion facilitator CzcD-associated flavoprotein CzcO